MINGVTKINKVLESIHLKNFFTHKDVTINFKSGLNYIVGPEGSGKSLILEAISFCFFGSTALRDVASSYKQFEATLIFNYLNKQFKIVRKIDDAVLYLKDQNVWNKVAVGTTPVNQQIITLFGYDYSIFVLSNYCQQGELQSFSKMTPAKKIAFIDKVSGIEDAKEFIKFLEERKKFLKNEITTVSRYAIEPTLTFLPEYLEQDLDLLLNNLEENKQNLLTYSLKKISLENNLLTLKNEFNSQSKNQVAEKAIVDILAKYDVETCLSMYTSYLDLNTTYTTLKKNLDKIEKTNYVSDFNIKDTVKDVEEFLARSAYNKKVDIKNKLLLSQHVNCPSCSFEFSVAHTELLQYSDIEITKKDIKKVYKYPEELLHYLNNDYHTYQQIQKDILDIQNKIQALSIFKQYIDQGLSLEDFNKKILNYLKQQSFLNDLTDKFNTDSATVEEQLKLHNASNNQQIIDTLTQDIYKYTKIKTEVEIYNKSKEIFDKASLELNKLKTELSNIVLLIAQSTEDTFKIKQAAIPLINYHASVLINSMTDSIISKISITENYNILVDNKNINVCCGSEKDTASLAFRLSLGNSIILGMLPLFLGDEIDAASKVERSLLMTDVLQNMSELGYQVLLITHKDTSNFENCNIIDLQSI